ncbi:MAG: class I SAM-dependent methyltransferase, partial [Nanoarchaeota archaeon]|nr:class I SAM-dependent methyltransferase [Nanoarchaeota archaeon]
KPDVVADIRKLPFKDNSFNTILACEIIEHIPFKDVPKALSELRRVAKKNVVISAPYSCVSLSGLFKLKIPFLGRLFNLSVYFPYDWLNPRKFKFNSEHYWEMGRKGYSKKKILTLFNKYFKLVDCYPELIQPEHYFFILEKRE